MAGGRQWSQLGGRLSLSPCHRRGRWSAALAMPCRFLSSRFCLHSPSATPGGVPGAARAQAGAALWAGAQLEEPCGRGQQGGAAAKTGQSPPPRVTCPMGRLRRWPHFCPDIRAELVAPGGGGEGRGRGHRHWVLVTCSCHKSLSCTWSFFLFR